MKPSGHILKQGLALFSPVFRKSGPYLIPIALFQVILDHLLRVGREPEKNLDLVAAQIVIGLLLSVVTTILSGQAVNSIYESKNVDLLKSLGLQFKWVLIENLRCSLAIIIRLPLLVVPALVEMIRLFCVPFVVQFDPRYGRGEIDALTTSRSLLKGHFLKVVPILLFVGLVSIVPEFWLKSLSILESPILYSVGVTISVLCEVYFSIVAYLVYRELAKGG